MTQATLDDAMKSVNVINARIEQIKTIRTSSFEELLKFNDEVANTITVEVMGHLDTIGSYARATAPSQMSLVMADSVTKMGLRFITALEELVQTLLEARSAIQARTAVLKAMQ